uniref:Galectin n=1 Tax=Panagrellus redivivus TaxID=6233 RepID=A0A7E4VY80_PANRE
MLTISALTLVFGVLLAAFVKAEDKEYPFVALQTCRNKAWVARPFGFQSYDAPNAPLHPARTFVKNYEFPYILCLTNYLYVGETIFIEGKIDENPSLVTFNLLAGAENLDDHIGAVALHWTQQYAHGNGFVTARINDQWDDLSSVLHTGLFAVNKPFKIAIRVLEDSYEIYKDGVKFGNFAHRAGFDIVDHIEIVGDVEINSIRVVGRHFLIPFKTKIHGTHLMLNDRIRVEARTFSYFYVNILNAKEDIAFQLFVDFNAKAMTRNSLINGTWGQEESGGQWYFQPQGYIFVLEIVNEDEHLSLMVNGDAFATFKHRVPNPKEDYIFFEVTNDIDIYSFEVCSD